MATEELKSTVITARENIRTGAGTTPSSKVINGGNLKQSVATFEFGVFDAASTYRVCEVPAHGRISKIHVKSDTAIVAATVDIGVYATTENGGAAINADCYATAFDVEAAAITTAELNLRYEVLGIETIEQAVWQDAGVAASPESGTKYDVVLTTAVAATTGGTVSVIVEYVTGD